MSGFKKLSILLLALVMLALIAAAQSGCGTEKSDATAGNADSSSNTSSENNASETPAEGSTASSQDGGTSAESSTASTTPDDSSNPTGQDVSPDAPPQVEISGLQKDLLGHWTNGISDIYISETTIIFAVANDNKPSSEADYVVDSELVDENILVINEGGSTEYIKFKDDRRAFNIYPDYDSAVRDLSETAFEYVDDRTSL